MDVLPTVVDSAVGVPEFKYIGLVVLPTVAVPSLVAVVAVEALPDNAPLNVVAVIVPGKVALPDSSNKVTCFVVLFFSSSIVSASV